MPLSLHLIELDMMLFTCPYNFKRLRIVGMMCLDLCFSAITWLFFELPVPERVSYCATRIIFVAPFLCKPFKYSIIHSASV